MDGDAKAPDGNSSALTSNRHGSSSAGSRKVAVAGPIVLDSGIKMHMNNEVEIWLRGQGVSPSSGSGSKVSDREQHASSSPVCQAGFVRASLYSTSTAAAYKRSGGYPLPSIFGYTGENQAMQTRHSSPSQWSVATKSTQCTTPRHYGSQDPHQVYQDTPRRHANVAVKYTASMHSSPGPQSARSGMNVLHVASPVTPRDYAGNTDEDEYAWRRKSADFMQKTAAWVFDASPRDAADPCQPQSSAGSDVYKSLVSYLDHKASSQDLRSLSPFTHQSSLGGNSYDGDSAGYCSDATVSDGGQQEEEEQAGLQTIITASIFPEPPIDMRTKSSDLLKAMKDVSIGEDEFVKLISPPASPFEESKGCARRQQKAEERQATDIFSFPVEAAAADHHDEQPAALFGVGSWPTFQLDKDSAASSPLSCCQDDACHQAVDGSSIQAEPSSAHVLQYNQGKVEEEYEELTLRVVQKRGSTGFEYHREIPLHVGSIIAGRYQIVELLGQAAFSRAVKAFDLKKRQLVCLKVVKNSKDYFDQSLDEIKVLRYVNSKDGEDTQGIVRLYDYFYFREHLILVMEILGANLYEFSKRDDKKSFFSPGNMKKVATQILQSLRFMHSISLIHADLKPENILIKSLQHCQIKVIDLGSSFFNHDVRTSFVQSRSYRAPEVILGAPYDYKIDIWSLGCILVELVTGDVLFQDYPGAQMLARMESIMGKFPTHLINSGKYARRYFLNDGRIFEQNADKSIDVLTPNTSNLNILLDSFDPEMADFVSSLLSLDPQKRPSADIALSHPWLQS